MLGTSISTAVMLANTRRSSLLDKDIVTRSQARDLANHDTPTVKCEEGQT